MALRRPSPGIDPSLWDEIRSVLTKLYVILDTETTGLLAPEMVSVAVIDPEGRTLVDDIVRPAKPIEPDAQRITGLTKDVVADKPEFPSVEPQLTSVLTGQCVIIYNAAYDVSVLQNTYDRYGLLLPQFETWCAMEWFARVYGEWNERRRSYTWQSLAKAAAYFEVPQENAHNALGDCLTTWNVLQAALQRAGFRMNGMDPLL